MPGRGFIIFWIFLLFFRNILARVEYERNSGVKFCFHFSGLSPPVLAKNNARKRFYNFSNFFTIFFRNFLARVEYERNSGVKFCFHFFSLSHPVLAKNNAGKMFYNFLNFFYYFFSEFSFLCRVWTEFRSEILFSLFRPISSHFD